MRSFEEWTSDMEKMVENKINEKRKERNNMKKKYLKLGAVAACLVIVIGAVAVIPYVANRNEGADLPETTVAVTEPAQSGDAIGPNGVGGSHQCQIHDFDYHAIPGELCEYVGWDSVDEWGNEAKTDDIFDEELWCSENITIKNFIEYFDISRDEFEKVVDLINYPAYDVDILYEGTDEEIDAHFRDHDAIAMLKAKKDNYNHLLNYFIENYHFKMIDEDVHFLKSIPEYVQMFNITQDELKDIIASLVEKYNMAPNEIFDYNFDIIYNEDGTFKNLPTFEGYTDREVSINIERMFCRR